MIDKINEMITERFETDDWATRIIKYDDNEIYIVDAIAEMLENAPSVSEYSIDTDTAFDSPGYEVCYLSVAFIENGKLEHICYLLEIE